MNYTLLQYNWIKGLDITQCRDFKSHPHLLSPRTAAEVTCHFSTKFVEFKNPFLYNSRVTVMAENDKSSLQPHSQVTEMILSLLADDGLAHPSHRFRDCLRHCTKQKCSSPLSVFWEQKYEHNCRRSFLDVNPDLTESAFSRVWGTFEEASLFSIPCWICSTHGSGFSSESGIQKWITTAIGITIAESSGRNLSQHFAFLNWHHISEWDLVQPCIFRRRCNNYWTVFYCLSYAESYI